MEEKSTISETSAEFSGFMMYAIIFKKKWYILAVTAIACIASVFYAFQLPNWYKATVNTVPPKTSGSAFEGALSSVSSTLKDLGLSKLSGKSGGGDQYTFLVILNSRFIADSLVKKYNIKQAYNMLDAKESDVLKAFLENIEITYEPEGNYTISAIDKDPVKATKMANDIVYYANMLSERIYKEETDFNVNYLEKRIAHIDSVLANLSLIISRLSNKYGIISPEDQAAAYVKSISEIKAELMKQEVVLDMVVKNYGEKDPTTVSQRSIVNSLKTKLANAENKPGLAGKFSMNDAASKGIEFLSYSAQYEAMTKVKAFLLPTLEDARLNQNRNLKNLVIIDPAAVPDKKFKPKRSMIVAGITLGTFFIAIMIVLISFGIKVFRVKYQNVKKNI